MSLYHEAAAALTAPASDGGNLKTRIFGPRSGRKATAAKSSDGEALPTTSTGTAPPAQVYALAVEACKWSAVLAEVIDGAGLLRDERRLTPVLALLLVHDLLVARGGGGVQLPPSHGLRAAVTRHKARLAAELTRARLRRRAPTLEALRAQVERAAATSSSTTTVRWVRVNRLRTTLDAQLASTFAGYRRVASLAAVCAEDEKDSDDADGKRIYVDEHVPDLVAVPLRATATTSTTTELIRSAAYKSGAIIFQDKASCFPAYLLDPVSVLEGGGDLVDACAAPGNKTSHLAALVRPTTTITKTDTRIFAFEKDRRRAATLQAMLQTAGALDVDTSDHTSLVRVAAGQDFLQVDPADARYARVRALLLDPSCSGSGIVGRDAMPTLHLPTPGGTAETAKAGGGGKSGGGKGKKRKREKEEKTETTTTTTPPPQTDPDRLAALAAFQLALLLHAFRFPAARRVTYSTCSVHAAENEHVVVRALLDAGARRAGWRLLRRAEQVAGMAAWPVRGAQTAVDTAEGVDQLKDPAAVADGCIRAYPDDGRGVMGFFVVAFVREADDDNNDDDEWGGFDD